MVRAIAFLEEKESENFFKLYICDIQRAFGKGLETAENSEKSSKFDKNFEGSCLKKEDFRVYNAQLSQKKTIKDIINVKINHANLEDGGIEGPGSNQNGNSETGALMGKNKIHSEANPDDGKSGLKVKKYTSLSRSSNVAINAKPS